MTWDELEATAPEIALLGKERLVGARVALLGTIRRDGSPRISPVEPYFSQGHLIFGAMSRSLKARDLRGDSRCVLHSAITDPDAGEGEFKLYGRAVEAGDEVRSGCEGWWVAQPRDAAIVFTLDIDQAAFVSWNLGQGKMTVRRWSPGHGLSRTQRSYP
jgi:hypothetical protein